MRDQKLEQLLARAKQLLETEQGTPDALTRELSSVLGWAASLPGRPGTVRSSTDFSIAAPKTAAQAQRAAERGKSVEGEATRLRQQLEALDSQDDDVVRVCADLRSLATRADAVAYLHQGVVNLVDVAVS